MVKILIFRSDRIGDLILTCPTIFTIKKYFKQCNITLIASDKNNEYAKKLEKTGHSLEKENSTHIKLNPENNYIIKKNEGAIIIS